MAIGNGRLNFQTPTIAQRFRGTQSAITAGVRAIYSRLPPPLV